VGGSLSTLFFIPLTRKGYSMSQNTSRRQFLKTSSALTAGATLIGGLTISQSAHAAGSDEIKLALIGCGGRGSGAIRDRVLVGDNCKVVAIADAFESNANRAANDIRRDADIEDNALHNKVDLPNDRVFHGLDSYKKAIACLNPGDEVLICTPPGFRPYHYRAAVERGCHVFMEKPIFVDVPGYHHTMETNKMADARNLKVCVGFQYRSDPSRYNWIEQIHAGKIGDIMYTRILYNVPIIWVRNREPGEGEMHFQVRNWYHFPWVCGDNIVEQHVHSIDIAAWIHRKGDPLAHPIEANAQGGRTFRAGPDELLRQAPPFADREAWDKWYQANRQAFKRHGQAWDHFFTEFTYADGSRIYSQARHMNNCFNMVDDSVYGTAGSGSVNNSAPSRLLGLDGTVIWENTEGIPKGKVGHQWEHDLHVKTIREDMPRNDGYSAAMTCMTAVLGREAAYSGKLIKWDELVEKGRSFTPDGEITSFEQAPPVLPDADGFYESSVPVPGVYNPFG